MKKILTFAFAALALAACTKEQPQPAPTGEQQVTIKFSPYEMSPMKTQSGVGTVCSRLDIYIIEQGTTDTLRWHQVRTSTTGFGTLTATLQTNRTYRLMAVGHNTDDTVTFRGGIVSFADNKVKQTMVADTVFSPGDGLSLQVVMKRIVGMFKLRISDADADFQGATHFRFVVNSSYNKWNLPMAQGVELSERTHTINGMTRGTDGYVTYNVYIIPDDLTAVREVDITVTALDASEGVVEARAFEDVPIRAGYVTRYTGSFFVTWDMGFSFGVGDWGEQGDYTY